jgi:hypothetical protein
MVLVLIMLTVPFVSAVVDSDTIPKSTGPDHADRPEAIALQKTQIAYVANDQNTRMTGTIRYIDIISNGTGTVTLQEIQDDYLVIASSVPLMQTAADIERARDSLGARAREFSDESKAKMVLFNGNATRLQACIRSMANASASRYSNSTGGELWLRNESSRLMVFNQESIDRSLIIRELANKSVNTSLIQNLSRQIDAQRPNLQGALMNKSSVALQSTNDAIRALNREFRQNVADTRAALTITMKRDAIMAMG